MENGAYQIGINPEKSRTRKGNAVRIIKIKTTETVEEEGTGDLIENEIVMFGALSSTDNKIYIVKEEDFENPGYKNPKEEAMEEKTKGRYKSYIGYDFGETIPDTVNGFRTMLEDYFLGSLTDEQFEKEKETGRLVFLGAEPNNVDPELNDQIRLTWLLKEDKKGHAMDEAILEKDEFVKFMLIPIEEPKMFTIHYINTDGEKTSQAVNSESEITDMKEKLYQMNN